MQKIITFLYALTIVFSLQAQDSSKLRVAVFDPSSSGTSIDEGTKIAVRELISSTLVNTGKYTIVERSLIDKILKEQKFSNTGAVDENQATELGKLAGANKVVLSVVTLIGGRNMLSVKLIDVETATIDQQKTKVVGTADLLDVVEPLTKDLIGLKAVYPTQSNSTETNNSTVTNTTNNTSSSQGIMYKLSPYRLSPFKARTTNNKEQEGTTNSPVENIDNTPKGVSYGISPFTGCGCQIQAEDAGTAPWNIAASLCPPGWRLPTISELQCMYKNKKAIGGFKKYYYWTSEAYDEKKGYDVDLGDDKLLHHPKSAANIRVRAVRSFNQ